MLRMSTLFLRTLREDPNDAEVPGHRLLVRAGYVRRAAPGIYSWLPLGLIVFQNVERVVREEMDRAGFQEVRFPALLPREPYELTNRWVEYGDNLFRLKDRRGNDFLLGPTHEEMFTLLVKDLFSSYKDLPVSLYQIQTKYRDEARPRGGLLRGREFVMKDSYSFDVDDAGLAVSYQKHRDAYIATFERLGLPFVIVSAMSGAMGGSRSEEFLAPLEVGEDTFVRSPGGYAANVEAVTTAIPQAQDWAGVPAAHVDDTPGTTTIESLVAWARETYPERTWSAADTLKHVVLMLTHPDGTKEPLVVGLPGDREVDLKRLGGVLEPTEVVPFSEADFAMHPALVKGYIGPGVLGADKPAGIRYLLDPRVVDGTVWISGADVEGKHVVDLVKGRDFDADGVIEAAEVRAGDPAARRVRPARAGPGHRDRPHLPTGAQVRRGARPHGARPVRQERGRHDGFVRHRGLARRGSGRRDQPRRARAVLAPRGRAGRRPRGDRRQGRGAHRGGRAAGGRARRRGRPGAARRPQGRVAGSEVQGRRAGRRAHDPGGGQGPGRRRGRGARPADRRAHRRRGRLRGRPRRGDRPRGRVSGGPVDAVVFDWGGTLTPWHDIDLRAQWYAYAEVYDPVRAGALAQTLQEAEESRWRRQQATAGAEGTGVLDAIFVEAGVDLDSARHHEALRRYLDFWDPHTLADPDAVELLNALRQRGIRVGVLSNTLWPRWHHEAVFARDGLLDLVDAAVYTSELPVGKPHADAFRAALAAVGAEAGRSVYVGDRLFEDVHGPQQVGMRAILVPHSVLPPTQVVAVEVTPDAVVARLGDVLGVVDTWRAAAG